MLAAENIGVMAIGWDSTSLIFNWGDIIMMIYICNRNDQCANKPCYGECYYTTDLRKSKLYHDRVKPKRITFVKDKNGDFWEMNPDPNWDNNLPELLRATPLTLIHRSYDQLVQEDMYNKKEF